MKAYLDRKIGFFAAATNHAADGITNTAQYEEPQSAGTHMGKD